MKKVKDITGIVFNGISAIARSGFDSTNKTTWECVCHCGKTFITTGLNLKSGNTKSCGCYKHRPVRKDITGKRFGRLVTVEIDRVINAKVWWKCVCDCGKIHTVSVAHLISGHTRSCGCLSTEASSANAKRNLGKSGKDHPRWDESKTDAERKRSRGAKMAIWSAKVLIRDNFQCCKCFSKGQMHAHHIVGYVSCAERRTDMANGVTLCRNCHFQFHKEYGYSGFSRSDFFEFINAPFVEDFSIFGNPPDGEKGNALKYLWRAGEKGDEIEDLKKAVWYIQREIERLTKVKTSDSH
jgi:hypothetical protein